MPKSFAFIGQHVNADQQNHILKVFREKAAKTGKPVVGTLLDGEELYYQTIRKFGSMSELMQTMQLLMDAGVIMYMGPNAAKKKVYAMAKEPY
jgi:hypothetical protein